MVIPKDNEKINVQLDGQAIEHVSEESCTISMHNI